jgi:hypothetical protein
VKKMATKSDVNRIMTMLAMTYPRFSLQKETIAVYARLLEDIPIDELEAAGLHCATTGEFFPSVHELRAAVSDLRRLAAHIPNTFEAWADLSRAGAGEWSTVEMSPFGSGLPNVVTRHKYQFLHPLVQSAAEMLGWPRSFPGDNPVADRAHFFRVYEQLVAEALAADARLPAIQSFVDLSTLQLQEGNHEPADHQLPSLTLDPIRHARRAESLGDVSARLREQTHKPG